MNYVLSETTLRKLLGGPKGIPTDGPVRQPGLSPADLIDVSVLPFDVFWARKAETLRVYLPSGCCLLPGGAEATVDEEQMDAVDGQDDWYEIGLPESSKALYAVTNIDGDTTSFYLAFESSEITKLAAAGAARKVAEITKTGTRFSVRALHRGTLALGGNSDSSAVDTTQKSLELVEIDGALYWQIYGFDSDVITQYGITDILKADAESGELSAQNGDQYFLLVQYVSSDGSRRVMRMPFGPGDGEDDDDKDGAGEGEGESSDCGVGNHPGKTGHEGDGEDSADGFDNSYWPSALETDLGGGSGADSNAHPGKQNDCW